MSNWYVWFCIWLFRMATVSERGHLLNVYIGGALQPPRALARLPVK